MSFAVEQAVQIRTADILVNRGRWPEDAKSFFSAGPVGLRGYEEGGPAWVKMRASDVRGFGAKPTAGGRRYFLSWRGRDFVVDVAKPDAEMTELMVAREVERQYGGSHSDYSRACRQAFDLFLLLTSYAQDENRDRFPSFDSKTDWQRVAAWPGMRALSRGDLLRAAMARPWRYYVPAKVAGHRTWEVPDREVVLGIDGAVPVEGVTSLGSLVVRLPVTTRGGRSGGTRRKVLPAWFDLDGLG